MLSVALVLYLKIVTGVTRYNALWCPDFPLLQIKAIRRPAKTKIDQNYVDKKNLLKIYNLLNQ